MMPGADDGAPLDSPRPWGRRARMPVPDLLIGLLLAGVAGIALMLINAGDVAHQHYFLPLAEAFLDGRLWVSDTPPWLNELVFRDGRAYVVYPPAPVLPLLPVLLLSSGAAVNQAWVSMAVAGLWVTVTFWLLRALRIRRPRAAGIALLMLFGTVAWFSAQLGTAWHYAHICALLFATTALLGWALAWPAWLVGLLWSLACLSRTAMLPGAVFLLALYLGQARVEGNPHARISLQLSAYAWRDLWPRLCGLAAGLLFPLIAYALYNDLRFGSPWQTGHALIPQLAQEWQYRHGFFSITSVPRNVYAMLFKAPGFSEHPPYLTIPRLGGLSILLTTPLFLWAVKARTCSYWTLGAWAAIALVLVPILLHGDVGGYQYGYRYAQDIYPFILMLLITVLPSRLRLEHWLAILTGLGMSALAAAAKLSGTL